MKVLTDTLSISPDLHHLSDYAGFQFYGITALPLTSFNSETRLIEPLGACAWSHSDDCREWTFALANKYRWSDGSPVTGQDYKRGILHVLASPTARFRLLFSELRNFSRFQKAECSSDALGLSLKGDQLHFSFDQPQALLPEILSLPLLSPMHSSNPALSAGPYQKISSTRLERNAHFVAPDQQIVSSIEFSTPSNLEGVDPYGFRAFGRGDLDLTCDTLFPASEISKYRASPEFFMRHGGLFAALTLGSLAAEIDPELRRMLSQLIQPAELSAALDSSFRPISGYEGNLAAARSSVSCSKSALLKIAFEEFYPNREIILGLAKQWRDFGIEIELCPEAYGSRSQACHLRFEIRQSPIGDPYLLYRAESKSASFKRLSSRWSEYCQLFLSYQASADLNARRLLGGAMEQLLKEEGIVIPLLSIPSLYLKAPTLRHHHFQPGKLWSHQS